MQQRVCGLHLGNCQYEDIVILESSSLYLIEQKEEIIKPVVMH